MNGAKNNEGYCWKDVPTIAYEFKHVWGNNIRVNEKYATDRNISCETFKPNNLDYIERIMRLMIMLYDQHGKLVIDGGEFVPHSLLQSTRTTGLSEPLVTPIPAQRSTPIAVRSNQTTLFAITPMKSPPSSFLQLENILVTTEEGAVFHNRIPELALLELAFDLFTTGKKRVPEIMKELEVFGLDLPKSFDLSAITSLSSQSLNRAKLNINTARAKLVQCLHNQGLPGDDSHSMHGYLT